MQYTRIRLAVFVPLLSAALSCGPDDRTFTIDGAFTASQRADIARAARKWNQVLDTPIGVEGGTWTMQRGQVPAGYAAWTDRDSRTVTIAPSVPDADIYAVVLHELGHSVGFAHHAEPGVMNPTYGAVEFSRADLAECPRVKRCKGD
jgi:hypothetical protein